jgi:hypothetical protein
MLHFTFAENLREATGYEAGWAQWRRRERNRSRGLQPAAIEEVEPYSDCFATVRCFVRYLGTALRYDYLLCCYDFGNCLQYRVYQNTVYNYENVL